MGFAHDWCSWALLSAVFAVLTAMVAKLGLAGLEQLPAVLAKRRLADPSRVINGDLRPPHVLKGATDVREFGHRIVVARLVRHHAVHEGPVRGDQLEADGRCAQQCGDARGSSLQSQCLSRPECQGCRSVHNSQTASIPEYTVLGLGKNTPRSSSPHHSVRGRLTEGEHDNGLDMPCRIG
jgi:hypothetical protein